MTTYGGLSAAELRALAGGAQSWITKRPWRRSDTTPGTVYDAGGYFVLDCWHEDAALIVAAVNALPALLDEADALRRRIYELEALCADRL